jgi:hypothetical protein
MTFQNSKTKLPITILILILASQGILETQATDQWNTQIVDTHGAGGKIIIDSQNNPHIIYRRENVADINDQPEGLFYAIQAGQDWEIQHLNFSADNIFIMDTDNKPHIISTSNGTLTNTQLTDSNWNLNQLGVGKVADDLMKLDSNGNLLMFSAEQKYFQANSSYENYLYYNNWTKTGNSETLLAETSSTGTIYNYLHPISISIDSQNNPHIIFTKETQTGIRNSDGYSFIPTSNDIVFAKWTGTGWLFETIATNASGQIGNLVLDSKGLPHLCYIYQNTTYFPSGSYVARYSVDYTYFDGNNWVNQTVEAKTDNVDYSHLALRLDANNNPQIYYYKQNYQNQSDSGLVAAIWTGSRWGIQNLGAVPSNGYGAATISSIAFDSYGNPCMVYSVVVGTYRSAERSGNLTFVSFNAPQNSQSPIIQLAVTLAIIIAVALVFLIIYRAKRKPLNGKLPKSAIIAP